MDVFAKRLKELRSQRGLNQVQLAELVGVHPRVYNRWERGGGAPRLDFLIKLADVLQVSLDELTGRAPLAEPDFKVKNPKLHALYRQIDRLSAEDQHALLILLDSLIKRAQMDKVLAS
jgi:transcriptional regulator with XRE-family HTH domain